LSSPRDLPFAIAFATLNDYISRIGSFKTIFINSMNLDGISQEVCLEFEMFVMWVKG
jgi:hypothetical protein